MMVAELRRILEMYPDDMEVFLSYDAGREGACEHGHEALDADDVNCIECSRHGHILEVMSG